jgi:hypothetical protein
VVNLWSISRVLTCVEVILKVCAPVYFSSCFTPIHRFEFLQMSVNNEFTGACNSLDHQIQNANLNIDEIQHWRGKLEESMALLKQQDKPPSYEEISFRVLKMSLHVDGLKNCLRNINDMLMSPCVREKCGEDDQQAV